MLPLAILGFLNEEPMHGYELKDRISALTGYVKPVSDGALYPAVARLESAGLVTRHEEEGAGAARRLVITLAEAGREELLRRLRTPKDVEVTDRNRFYTILAFLSTLPDPADQAAVLHRRLEFISTPSSFFHRSSIPVRAEDTPDPYRRGMLLMARTISQAERAWLHQAIQALQP